MGRPNRGIGTTGPKKPNGRGGKKQYGCGGTKSTK